MKPCVLLMIKEEIINQQGYKHYDTETMRKISNTKEHAQIERKLFCIFIKFYLKK